MLAVLAGCASPTSTHQGGPATPGTSAPGAPPTGKATTPTSKATTSKTPTASLSAQPAGAVSIDQIANPTCTWVPRMFVDVSGKTRPGVRVRVPLWVTRLKAPGTFTVRGGLHGPNGERATDTVTADTPPEWRGSAFLAMAIPANDDHFRVYVEADVERKLSDGSVRTVIDGAVPSSRPTAEANLPCKRVT
jgi:hypothetical protein